MIVHPLYLLLLSVADNKSDEVLKYQTIGNAINDDAQVPMGNVATPLTSSSGLNRFLLHDQLYYNVISGDYDNAALLSMVLEQNNNGQTVADVVNRLLSNGTENIMAYAYKLWHYGNKGIVVSYFPEQFQHILNEDLVKLVNVRDGLPVKLDVNAVKSGDRPAWGDASDRSTHRLTWKFISICEGNKVYFKLLNLHREQYLYLEVAKDLAGVRKAFGADDSDTDRHQWYLRQVKYNGSVVFYIYNRKYDQPLMLARELDSYQDRRLSAYHYKVLDNAEHYGWHINAIE